MRGQQVNDRGRLIRRSMMTARKKQASFTYQSFLFIVAVACSFLTWQGLTTTVPFPPAVVVDHPLAEGFALPALNRRVSFNLTVSHHGRILKPCNTTLNELVEDSTTPQSDSDDEVPTTLVLRFQSIGNDTSRHINSGDEKTFESERLQLLDRMDNSEIRWDPKKHYHDDEIEDDPPGQCYRPNWKSKFHPNCNDFHEFEMLAAMAQKMLTFRGEATFRAAWTYNSDWVLKTIRFEYMRGLKIALGLQKEANIMDVLSKSPRIIDIYGFCGLNTMAEFMPDEPEDDMVRRFANPALKAKELREKENRVRTLNHLSSLELLDMSIRLAESVADIHGFEGGIIVHGDLNTEQWLRNSNGEIKLNDFNNGFVMDWSNEKQRYCGQSHPYNGGFSPLESQRYFHNVSEQVDVYGFGGSLYTLMTGLYPYWQFDRKERNKRISTGIPVPMESWWRQNNTLDLHLSDLILWCMDGDFSKRPSIFEVIDQLKKLRQMFLEGNLLGRRRNDTLPNVGLTVEGSDLSKNERRR